MILVCPSNCQTDRSNIIGGAIKLYNNQLNLHDRCIKSIYRSVSKREVAKQSKGKCWYTKGGYSSMMKSDFTPEGNLSTMVQKSLGAGVDKDSYFTEVRPYNT